MALTVGLIIMGIKGCRIQLFLDQHWAEMFSLFLLFCSSFFAEKERWNTEDIMGHNSLGEWMIFSPAGLLKLKLSMCHVKVPEYISGWWFGTWFFVFFHILGISSSQLSFIFFRGVETTSQYRSLIENRVLRTKSEVKHQFFWGQTWRANGTAGRRSWSQCDILW